MKSFLIKSLALVCVLGIWGTASADFREVWTCTIKEGKTMDDVRAANSRWVKFINANVDGGGHECAGTNKFVSAHLTPILENIKQQIRDLKLLEEKE